MRKTFRELAAANRRNSFLLIASMTLLCVFIGGIFGSTFGKNPEEGMFFGIMCGSIVAIIASLIAWFGGDTAIMSFHGATEIKKEQFPQLFNVVEEVTIAAGIPMPRIFVIQTDALNAFATGISPEKASVAITTGLLNKLNRDELQGVMAHEIAHIRNYDIRFSMLMATLAGGIVIMSEIFLRSWFFRGGRRSDRKEENGAQQILMIVGILLAILAPLITALIQMAMSRQREYLADASAIEFTRNPQGLASALRRLANDTEPMEYSKAAESMFIVNPALKLRHGVNGLFSTHPPIEERIKRLYELAG